MNHHLKLFSDNEDLLKDLEDLMNEAISKSFFGLEIRRYVIFQFRDQKKRVV